MDHVQFPYRSTSHLALMHVINETGAWERNGLKVDFDKIISRGDAHDLVPTGEVEFVSGNHVSTYAARAKGDTWQYLGQTVSKNNLFLITRPDAGINKLEDVRKRKFGNRGRHPGLNTWLYLKQAGLNPDTDQVELVTEVRDESPDGAKKVKGKSLLSMVADSDVDAAFVNQPRTEQARRMGLKVIDIPTQDMIFFMTISSSAKMVTERPDVVKRVLKSVLEGIAYFKQNRDETIKILLAEAQEGRRSRSRYGDQGLRRPRPAAGAEALSKPGRGLQRLSGSIEAGREERRRREDSSVGAVERQLPARDR